MYDLVVVGARVAGSSTALLAARAGLRVLVVDRKTFPSDTLSTNYIHQPGCARLVRWGLLERIIASGCPPIRTIRFQVKDIVIKGGCSGYQGQVDAYAPRRIVLDSILVGAAREAGAEVRENCSAVSLIEESGRIVGINLGGPDGKVRTERARLVVGADGMRSTIARLVRAEMTVEDPKMTCIYYSFWEGLAAGAEIYEGATSWVTTVPSNDAVLVLTYFPQGQFSRVRSNAVRAHLDAVEATAPALFVRMRSARQKEKIWGTGDQQNFFRAAAGPGWALVGDAGHHKDSITALGITDALAQAELLVSHIAGNLSNPQELNEALARFAADRDALLIPGYRATLATAKLLTDIDIPENEQRLDFLRTVAADRTLTQLYFDVFARIKSFTELADALNT